MTSELKKVVKELGKHSMIYGVGNLLQKITSLLMLPIYTQFLTAHEYGIKELVGLSTDVIAILIATALSSSFYRFYMSYDSDKDKNEVVSTILISVGAVGLVAVVILAYWTELMARVILDDPELYYFFLISFASLFFQTINGISYSYLKANNQSVKFIILSLVKLLFVLGLNIYFVAILKIGVVGVLISTLLGSIAITALLTIPMLKKVGFSFSSKKLREIIKYGLPIVPAQFGAFIVHLSDRFFIKEYVSLAEAGIYSLGYRIGSLPANFLSDPFNQIFQPKRIEIYEKDNAAALFGKIFTYYLTVISLGALVVSALAKEVLMIMSNEEYWAAAEIVPLIVLATTIFSFHYHLNIGIVMSKNTKYFAYISLSNAVLVIFLNFLLIPTYGVFGAAWATIIAFVYKAVLTYYFSSRYFKVHFEKLRLMKLLFVVAVIYVAVQNITQISVQLSFVFKLVAILISYPVLLYIVKFFTDSEKQAIVTSIKGVKVFLAQRS
jgi:O-antigen/teichoic acid export membrane protein